MNNRLYLSPPYMCGSEQKYVQEAFDTNWVAPLGPNVTKFEQEMAAYIGIRYAVATNAGTAAIHLALRYLGVGPRDFVFCSDLTFAGSCNPILYQHAKPVFIDSEPDSLNMSPAALSDALAWAKREGKLPKAVIIVDLYGQSADYDVLLPICRQYGVPVIEDAAEAVGTLYGEKHCGTFGEIGTLSFNGNKIINTSGGGMVLSDDEDAAKKMMFWATQAREKEIHYEHVDYGYNYRLSNICAGIGRGQLEGLAHKIDRRKKHYMRYASLFEDSSVRMLPFFSKGTPNYWLSIAILPERVSPAKVCALLAAEDIESRPTWKPLHEQPVFRDCKYFSHEQADIGMKLFAHGICLPSGEAMTEAQQDKVADIVKKEAQNR